MADPGYWCQDQEAWIQLPGSWSLVPSTLYYNVPASREGTEETEVIVVEYAEDETEPSVGESGVKSGTIPDNMDSASAPIVGSIALTIITILFLNIYTYSMESN